MNSTDRAQHPLLLLYMFVFSSAGTLELESVGATVSKRLTCACRLQVAALSERCSLGALSAEAILEPKHFSVCTMSNLKPKNDFSQEQWELLTFRTNHLKLDNICKNHEMLYLSFYPSKQKFCCDPSDNHKSKPPKGSVNITLARCQSLQSCFPVLKPGRKLCSPCYTKMSTASKKLRTEKIREGSSPLDSDDTIFAHPGPSLSQQFLSKSTAAGVSTRSGTQSSQSSDAQSQSSEERMSTASSFHLTPKTSKI